MDVGPAVFEQVLDEARQLGRRGGDGFGGAEACFHTPHEGPQGTLRAVQTAGGKAQGDGDAMCTWSHPPRQHLPARDLVLGTQPQPATEVFHVRPPVHVRAALAEDDQGGAFFDPLNGRQGDACHAIKRGAGIGTGGRWSACVGGPWGQGLAITCIAKGLQRHFHLLSALGHLLVVDFRQLDGLASGTQVRGAPKALQGLGHVVRIVVTVRVAPLCQALRMALAREDGFDDGHAGHASEVTDNVGELEVHLWQRLLHGLHMVGGLREEHVAVTPGAAQPAHLVSRPQGAREQPIGVQALPPRAVEPIGLRSTGGTLGLPGIAEEDLQAAGLQQLEPGHPVDPSRFHSDGGHATVHAPVGEGVEVGGERAETAHGWGVATRRHGDPMLGFADVEASGVEVANLAGCREHGGRRVQRGRWTRVRARGFVGCHRSLPKQETAPRTAVGAGVTEKRAVSQTGSGRGLSPVR